MFRRLFPNLAKLDVGELLGVAVTIIFLWVAIAGITEGYFIDRGWIKVKE